MGRLYWKFFLFFFFAQLTAVLVVSLAIGMVNDKRERERRIIDSAPSARTMVLAAASTLKISGIVSLKSLLDIWQSEPMPQLYAVNEAGLELLNRQLPKGVNTASLAALTNDSDSRAIQKIQADDGHVYWLFVEPRNRRPPPSYFNGVRPQQKFRYLFPMMPLIVGIFVSLLFAAMLAWYFSKPIKQLRFAFESAAGGNLDARVGTLMQGRRDELADLGTAFDVMVSRVSQLIQSQTHLMHQVSHELRSPLARLQIAIGLIKQQTAQSDTVHPVSEKIATSLNRIETESVRMDHLVGELLTLSRLESGMTALQKEPIDLNELLQELVEDANFEGATNHVHVQCAANAAIQIQAQPDLLQRAIDNVVRNAVKYSPANATVDVSASIDQAAKQVVIRVMDKGPGVKTSDLEAIFKPFYRANADTETGVKGYGLGLAITKQIIEAHAGEISASSTVNAGLVITIKLPVI
ncbi:MAG: ATP-binding protein, partial [Pseudomonadota bacterium]